MTLAIAWSGPSMLLVARHHQLAAGAGARGHGSFRDALGARTPLSAERATRLLAEAWHHVLGERPSERTLALLWAHWALETGRGRLMRGNNFGGLKGEGPEGGSAVHPTREGRRPHQKLILSRFRAYPTAEAGARDYVRTLAERYPEALGAARSGSPRGFVAALAGRRYFTASAATYLRAIRSLAREFVRARALRTAIAPVKGVATALVLGGGKRAQSWPRRA